jgi:hypothetical protein
MSKAVNKKSAVRGTGMFAMPSKKDKAKRPDRKQKHKNRLEV